MISKAEQLNLSIPTMPKHETPSFRLAEHSGDYLSDAELLSLLLKSNYPAEKRLQIAQEIIASYGSLNSLAKLTTGELKRFPGIGKRDAESIKSALILGRRMQRGNPAEKPQMNNPEIVAEYLQPIIGHLDQEEFHVLLLNTKNALIRNIMITRGLVDRTQVHAREIFRLAIKEACSRVILAHNHPSGDVRASAEDIKATENLVQSGKILGIEVLDHIIVGKTLKDKKPYWTSLREEGIIK